MLYRLWDKLKRLWGLALAERASPREIFWAIFVGVFAGCTPAVGVHGPLAIGLATLFRKNRLFAWFGSRISNFLILPFIIYAEIQLAHRVREGTWASISLEREAIVEQAQELLLDWCLGSVPVGAALGVLLGGVAWVWAKRRRPPTEPDELASSSPARSLEPSSG